MTTDRYQELFNIEAASMKQVTKVISFLFLIISALFTFLLFWTHNLYFIDYIIIFLLGIVLLINNITFNTDYKVKKILNPKAQNLFWTLKYWKINLFVTYVAFAAIVFSFIDLISLLSVKVVSFGDNTFDYKYLTYSISLVLFIMFVKTIKNELKNLDGAIKGIKN